MNKLKRWNWLAFLLVITLMTVGFYTNNELDNKNDLYMRSLTGITLGLFIAYSSKK